MSIIAKFQVNLSEPYDETITVDYTTRDNTAIAGTDYQATSGQLTFLAGETQKDINILVFDRAAGSPDISFYVDLEATTNAVLGDSTAECIISVDSEGALVVYNFQIPTGPKGIQGKSAYEVAVDNGFSGTVQQWLDSLNGGTAKEIAQEVAPLVNFNETFCTAEGTLILSHVDSVRMKTLARRFAYADAAKIATRALVSGDNTFLLSELSGDTVNPSNVTFYMRFFRNGARIELDWSYDENNEEFTVLNATQGDFLIVTEYDFFSAKKIALLSSLESTAENLKSGAFTEVGTAAEKDHGTSEGNVQLVGLNGWGINQAKKVKTISPENLLKNYKTGAFDPEGDDAHEDWDSGYNAVLQVKRNDTHGWFFEAGEGKTDLWFRNYYNDVVLDSVKFAFQGEDVSFNVVTAEESTAKKARYGYVPKPIVGTTHTITEDDLGKILLFDTTDPVIITLPQASTEELWDGFAFNFRNKQTGVITLAPEGTDQVLGSGTVTNAPRKVSTCYRESTGVWVSVGDLS